ncbi:MAG: fructokinase [Ignavibacteria bacterium]|nr:MAG: fructokinase [Ignavibacteria bacterium]KAF0159003.1 MAG: fructokinase [Ignavibacteria bacterium]
MFGRHKSISAFGEILWDIYPDKKRLGGAPFNFIYHIWKIVGKANFISSVGRDSYGEEILAKLNSMDFDTSRIIVDEEHPTGTVLVELDKNKVPRFTPTCNCCYDFLKLSDKLTSKLFSETDILYFGTFSSRSEITRNTLVSLFNQPKLKYFCDLNLRHSFYSKELVEQALFTSNVVKMNDEELDKLREMFHLPQTDEDACKVLLNNFRIELIGLTLGENGAYLFSHDESNYYKPMRAEIIDTLGAGDAFAAILCLGYLTEMPLSKTNQYANEFALEVCKVNGALPDESAYSKYISLFR